MIGRMTKAEKRALEDAPDMVLFIAQWIAESPRGNRSTDRITNDHPAKAVTTIDAEIESHFG